MPRGIRLGTGNNGSQILKNLNKEIRRIKGATATGVRLAVAMVKTESQARTPVDTGNLKGGHYTAVEATRDGTVGEVGVMADYAIYVHENMQNHHPVGEAKFLERAIGAKRNSILEIIRRTARIR